MHSVSRFEANLLRLLWYFLHRELPERALPLLENRCAAPPCLHRNAVHLIQDALSKGCVSLLARRGGWRRERFLRGERVVEGRLWERTPPAELGLTFSAHTLRFLIWITANRPGDTERGWLVPEEELTLGDRLLLYFAHEGLRKAAEFVGTAALRTRQPFVRHALCWLAFPEDFTAAPADARPNFAPWTSGVGACLLEALQPELARRWIEVESSKERLADPQAMRVLGLAQERVLTAFLDAIEQAGRMDLARFLLQAAAVLLRPHAHAGMWTAQLSLTGQRVADRTAAYQAATIFLRILDRLQFWERRARGVGYFDEGYVASQLWKADWEQVQGDRLTEHARAIVQQLDPMRQASI
ncbi:MAG TPA: hypothetical protein VMF69_05735 [Gemmataceae bacterium]|nr:hypothetical protein [Gemmataceae bacterium]